MSVNVQEDASEPGTTSNREGEPPIISGYLGMVPFFSGERGSINVIQFFRCFEQVAFLAKWRDASTLIITLRASLKGRPLLLFCESEAVHGEDYERIKGDMISEFSPKTTNAAMAMEEFIRTEQRKGESVREFTVRVKSAMEVLELSSPQYNNIKGEMLKEQFILGLVLQIQQEVIRLEPKNLEEAVRQAENFVKQKERYARVESKCAVVSSEEVAVDKVEACVNQVRENSSSYEDEIKELRSKVESLTTLMQSALLGNRRRGRIRRKQLQCFECGNMGHIRRSCPHRVNLN
ncbi:uncharacterized protein LOC111621784 [Centruroides sculpturatus]|uniref:uncharacterized protein LOC111621784 n=1 Tax=Centruroides sculpturatus TaxID=218467 RepID=UPI000C6D0C30|nr:uncharacterized protein LOC111621784 [Centruroides sculpturatus]